VFERQAGVADGLQSGFDEGADTGDDVTCRVQLERERVTELQCSELVADCTHVAYNRVCPSPCRGEFPGIVRV